MWDSCNCTPSSQPCLTGSLLSTQTSVSLIKARADCTQALQLLTCSSLPSLTHLNEPQRGQPCIALITQTLRLRAAGPPARQQSDIRDFPPPQKKAVEVQRKGWTISLLLLIPRGMHREEGAHSRAWSQANAGPPPNPRLCSLSCGSHTPLPRSQTQL